MSHLSPVELPSVGVPDALPTLPLDEYEQRLQQAVDRMDQAGYDLLAIYGDREHFATLTYLTGFDPRFEEALLILDRQGNRTLLVGNECLGYLPDPALNCRAVLHQDFSLLGQDRSKSPPLRTILQETGIGPGKTIGCVGWKYFTSDTMERASQAIEIPAYLVDLFRDMCDDPQHVRNATNLFMNPVDGLRLTNSVDQIAQFEFAASHCSENLRSALQVIQPGAMEYEIEAHLQSAGLPLSCHRMVSFGEKAKRGLSSPSANRAKSGDSFTMALGVWGALTCRAGVIAQNPDDLSADLKSFFSQFVENYFDVVATWYETIRLGVPAGEVVDAVTAQQDPDLYHFAVNPGHAIHLDEWVHSPFVPESQIPLYSGMALQMDIIPVSQGPFCYTNAEDGIVLADQTLRDVLANRYPECWQRMQTRRRFMTETLGIQLDQSVLPLSNIPGWLPPYVLTLDQALVKD